VVCDVLERRLLGDEPHRANVATRRRRKGAATV
jgi:hypothetical protein